MAMDGGGEEDEGGEEDGKALCRHSWIGGHRRHDAHLRCSIHI